MGATLARLIREGHTVGAHIFSESDSIEGNDGIKDEIVESLQGVYNIDFAIHTYRTMYFHEQYQAIRNDIFSIKQAVAPDIVFCKSPNSLHPDHRVVGEAVESIFLDTTIYAIEGIRDSQRQRVNKWVEVSPDDIMTKLRALGKYDSQKRRHYHEDEIIRSWAKFRGNQIGADYAEAFEVIREVS